MAGELKTEGRTSSIKLRDEFDKSVGGVIAERFRSFRIEDGHLVFPTRMADSIYDFSLDAAMSSAPYCPETWRAAMRIFAAARVAQRKDEARVAAERLADAQAELANWE